MSDTSVLHSLQCTINLPQLDFHLRAGNLIQSLFNRGEQGLIGPISQCPSIRGGHYMPCGCVALGVDGHNSGRCCSDRARYEVDIATVMMLREGGGLSCRSPKPSRLAAMESCAQWPHSARAETACGRRCQLGAPNWVIQTTVPDWSA